MKTLTIIPNESFHFAGENEPRIQKGEPCTATIATNQPDYAKEGKVFANGLLLTSKDYRLPYRKHSLEAKLDSLLPQFPSYDVIAHELWADGEGSYSVNDSWHLARGCNREEAISHLRGRWEIFKINYAPKARVCDLTDANWSGDEFPSLLEVDCIPFAEIRDASK